MTTYLKRQLKVQVAEMKSGEKLIFRRGDSETKFDELSELEEATFMKVDIPIPTTNKDLLEGEEITVARVLYLETDTELIVRLNDAAETGIVVKPISDNEASEKKGSLYLEGDFTHVYVSVAGLSGTAEVLMGVVGSTATPPTPEADVIYYIDPTGNDTTGDGTLSNPWATWDRACLEIPDYLDHRHTIKAAAGTYTSFPRLVSCTLGPDGQLALEGRSAPTVLSGPHTITTATKVNTNCGWNLTVSGAGWSADQWYGKFIRMTSGSASGMAWPIGWNTTDTISISYDVYGTTIANGDTFEIIDTSVRIESVDAPRFNVNVTGPRDYSQFILCNLEFYTDLSWGDYEHYYSYVWKCDCNSLIGLCRFIGETPSTGMFEMLAGLVNIGPAQWDNARGTGHLTDLEDEGLVMTPDGYQAHGSVHFMGTVTPPTTSGWYGWFAFVGAQGNEFGCYIANMVCRKMASGYSARCETSHSIIGYAYADHNTMLALAGCRIYGPAIDRSGIRVDDRSFADLYNVYVDACADDAVLVQDVSDVIANNVNGDSGNIGEYGMRVGALCRVKIENTGVEGASGKVRLTQIDETLDYPITKKAITDECGSFVTA